MRFTAFGPVLVYSFTWTKPPWFCGHLSATPVFTPDQRTRTNRGTELKLEPLALIRNLLALHSKVKLLKTSSQRFRGTVNQRLTAYGDHPFALFPCLCTANSPVPGHSGISQHAAPLADSRSMRARSPPGVQAAAAWSSFSEDRTAVPAEAACQRAACRACHSCCQRLTYSRWALCAGAAKNTVG